MKLPKPNKNQLKVLEAIEKNIEDLKNISNFTSLKIEDIKQAMDFLEEHGYIVIAKEETKKGEEYYIKATATDLAKEL